MCERLAKGVNNLKQSLVVSIQSKLVWMKAFVENLPHINHALVDSMKGHPIGSYTIRGASTKTLQQ